MIDVGGRKYGGFSTHEESSKIQSFLLQFFQCVHMRCSQCYREQILKKVNEWLGWFLLSKIIMEKCANSTSRSNDYQEIVIVQSEQMH